MRPPEKPHAAPVNAREVHRELRSLADPRVRAAMPRFGVFAENAHGISMPVLHKLARQIKTNHALALALWKSRNHEARILAAMIADRKEITPSLMERWARDFDSWDIVDGTCGHYFCFSPHAWQKTKEWSRRKSEFAKRAGFTLVANLAVHDKGAPDSKFAQLLPIIQREARDGRNFVKKAVNWALRQIGKRNLHLNRLAIQEARRIRKIDSSAARWIAADALRELTSAAVQKRLREKR